MSTKRRLSSGNQLLGLVLEDENEEEVDILANVCNNNAMASRPKAKNTGGRRRSSFGGSLATLKSPQKSLEQSRIADMYKTVIKMSSENKINEKNSWGLDLIDHMSKLIKEDSSQRGVNFQKVRIEHIVIQK